MLGIKKLERLNNPLIWADLLMLVAMYMAFCFGQELAGTDRNMGYALGTAFAGFAFIASHALKKAGDWHALGDKPRAWGGYGFWGLIVVLEVLGYTAVATTVRMENSQSAHLSSASFESALGSVEQHEMDRTEWIKRRDKLLEEKGWLATVSADALKAEIAGMEGDRLYARSKQCGNVTKPDSKAFCAGLTELRTKLADTERVADIDAKIEATSRLIAQAKDAAGEQSKNVHVSHADAQGKVLAGIFKRDLSVSSREVEWAMIAVSLLFAIAMASTGIIRWLFAEPQNSPVTPAAEHPDLLASLKAQASQLAGKLEEMKAKAPPLPSRYEAGVATPDGALNRFARIEWKAAA